MQANGSYPLCDLSFLPSDLDDKPWLDSPSLKNSVSQTNRVKVLESRKDSLEKHLLSSMKKNNPRPQEKSE